MLWSLLPVLLFCLTMPVALLPFSSLQSDLLTRLDWRVRLDVESGESCLSVALLAIVCRGACSTIQAAPA